MIPEENLIQENDKIDCTNKVAALVMAETSFAHDQLLGLFACIIFWSDY